MLFQAMSELLSAPAFRSLIYILCLTYADLHFVAARDSALGKAQPFCGRIFQRQAQVGEAEVHVNTWDFQKFTKLHT